MADVQKQCAKAVLEHSGRGVRRLKRVMHDPPYMPPSPLSYIPAKTDRTYGRVTPPVREDLLSVLTI